MMKFNDLIFVKAELFYYRSLFIPIDLMYIQHIGNFFSLSINLYRHWLFTLL